MENSLTQIPRDYNYSTRLPPNTYDEGMIYMRKSLLENEYKNIRLNSGFCGDRYSQYNHATGFINNGGGSYQQKQLLLNESIKNPQVTRSIYPNESGFYTGAITNSQECKFDP